METYINNDDPEYGSVRMNKKLKRIYDYINVNKRKVKSVLLTVVVVTISLLVRYSFDNVEKINDNRIITFDEPPYEIVEIYDINTKIVDRENVIQFPIKTSLINKKLQIMNIESIENQIKRYLEETGNICIHARFFGCIYDILVFNNVTVINPDVISLSNTKRNVQEKDIDGVVKFSKRSTHVTLNYIDKHMEYKQKQVLSGNQAICFQFYEM